MKLFLVRHGLTEEHAVKIRQSPESKLSDAGVEQAKKAAGRLKREGIEVVFASPWPRAKETAEVIAKELGLATELREELQEIGKHPVLNKIAHESELNQRYIEERDKSGGNLDWKFMGGGESLREVRARAIEFRDHLLEKHLGQAVLVVSHGVMMGCLIGVCVLGGKGEEAEFIKFIRTLRFDNTGVSLLEYEKKDRQWRMRFLNDHGHLR
jgi:broad specificity phosphatase PhoE